jgi:hypothetical protein
VAGFFDEPDPAEIENDYIDAIIPTEGVDLWERSIEESDRWDSMSPEEHMQAADLFASAAYSGSITEAEDFTDLLDIEWDNVDIGEFWDMYEALAG